MLQYIINIILISTCLRRIRRLSTLFLMLRNANITNDNIKNYTRQ